jgi:hypothetical protein
MIFSTDNPGNYFNPTRDKVNNTNDSLHRTPTSQNDGINIFNNLLPPSHIRISKEKDKLQAT